MIVQIYKFPAELSSGKVSLRLVIGCISGHCGVRQGSGTNLSQIIYEVCCDEEKLETIEHLLCNCPALRGLSLRTLGRGFFESLSLDRSRRCLVGSVLAY